MQHDFSQVFDTDSPYWQKVLDIFAKNEKYEKKIVSNRNLHHKYPRSFSKKLGQPIDNDKDNLISLSLADHFLVHYYYYLLAKKGFRQSMATAFTFMAKKGLKFITPNTAEAMAKDYEEAKEISKQIYKSEEFREKCRMVQLRSDVKARRSVAMKGKNKGKVPWNKGTKGNYKYSYLLTEDRKNTISDVLCNKSKSEFGKAFREYYGFSRRHDVRLYEREKTYYRRNGKLKGDGNRSN